MLSIMSYLMSAGAEVFHPTSRNNTTDLVADIPTRSIEEIGVFENGMFRPYAGVTSQLVWREATQISENFQDEVREDSDQSITMNNIQPIENSEISANPSASIAEVSSIRDNGNDQYESDPAWQANEHLESPLWTGIMAGQTRTHPILMNNTAIPYYGQLFYSGFIPVGLPQFVPYRYAAATHGQTSLEPPTPYQSDIPQDGTRKWIPQYHKERSAYLERANHAVEEFKIYFGDGNGDILDPLRKICYLCNLVDRKYPPVTEEDCTALLRNLYINVFDLIAAGRADQAGNPPPSVPTFRSSKRFFDYCSEEGKICPRWIGKANKLFHAVMDRFQRAN